MEVAAAAAVCRSHNGVKAEGARALAPSLKRLTGLTMLDFRLVA